MLNGKHLFSKGKSIYKAPLSISNFESLKEEAIRFENYLSNVKDIDSKPILRIGRKTGFLGLIINLNNMKIKTLV